MSSFATIRQVFYGIVVIAGAMTIFMYNWLDRYFEQKQKLQLAAIEAFEQNIGRLIYRDSYRSQSLWSFVGYLIT